MRLIDADAVDECEELMTDIKGDTVYAVKMSDIRKMPTVCDIEQIRTEILDTFLWEGQTEETLNSSVRKCLAIIDKYAEQEPCDNVVSKEVVIEWLKTKDIIKMSSQEEMARKELKALPSVRPQELKYENCKKCRRLIELNDCHMEGCCGWYYYEPMI